MQSFVVLPSGWQLNQSNSDLSEKEKLPRDDIKLPQNDSPHIDSKTRKRGCCWFGGKGTAIFSAATFEPLIICRYRSWLDYTKR